MHPLMDLSGLTDQQVMDKMSQTSSRLMAARTSGMSSALTDQIQLIMISYQEELSRRSEPPVPTEKCLWDMDKYLEQSRHDTCDEQEEDIPKWQSAADGDFSDLGDIEGGGSFLD